MSQASIETGVEFDNSYAKELDGFYVPWKGDEVPAPKLVRLNTPIAKALGFDLARLSRSDLAAVITGAIPPAGATPIVQAYAGHQFGNFTAQLGDGRALLLGEVVDNSGKRYDIQLKGSGRTPFSRGGDGKAVLGPVLREYIVGEAMHALGIPTTRALGAAVTGEKISRDGELPGAVFARVSSSHIRVGTFQFFAARGETEKVRQLADYTIARHYPELKAAKNPYLGLLASVRDAQARLLAKWMTIGFVHGVMNTDNMTVSGETIDYGPCAYIDAYDPKAVFSSIDTQGRYAYGNQPVMAKWNLARFAETLLPLFDQDNAKAIDLATNEINAFAERFQQFWLQEMRLKLGLTTIEDGDIDLVNGLYTAMDGQNVDFTKLFRNLADVVSGNISGAQSLFDSPKKFDEWNVIWAKRLARDPIDVCKRMAAMNAVNPIYIPRNHKVEEALKSAERDTNYDLFDKLMLVLANPYEKRDGLEEYEVPAPKDFGPYQTFCGT